MLPYSRYVDFNSTWTSVKTKKGINIMGSKLGDIPAFTVIATFDAKGNYPLESGKRHTAVYISHSEDGIRVYDQWNGQGKVKSRVIYADRKFLRRYVNRAENYFVVETE